MAGIFRKISTCHTPGLNKVLHAVGRVIRTEEDRGIVLLIDERFSRTSYKKLFPEEWKNIRYVANTGSIRKTIGSFWAGGGKGRTTIQ
jgi:Rad3-related DNA helicase